MFVVAHRGGSPDHHDNTATAFRVGIAAGADLLEFDVLPSADDELLVLHETKIFETPVKRFATDELRALVPSLLTFDELLQLIAEEAPTIRLVVDLKSRDADRIVADYLHDPELRERVLVTSTFSMGLRRLRLAHSDLRTGLSRGATFTRIPVRYRPFAARTIGRCIVLIAIPYMKLLGINVAALRHELIDQWTIRFCRRFGIRVDAWTVDDTRRASELQALGVDLLTTNVPESILRLPRP